MNRNELLLRAAALDFVRKNLHIIEKSTRDECTFDNWWNLNHHLYGSQIGGEVFRMALSIIAIAFND